MALKDLKYIVDGPGELDTALSLLRYKRVEFTLANNLGHSQYTTTEKQTGKRKFLNCIIRLWKQIKATEVERKFVVDERNGIDFSQFFGSGEIFEIGVEILNFEPRTAFHNFLRAYYSLKVHRGVILRIKEVWTSKDE